MHYATQQIDWEAQNRAQYSSAGARLRRRVVLHNHVDGVRGIRKQRLQVRRNLRVIRERGPGCHQNHTNDGAAYYQPFVPVHATLQATPLPEPNLLKIKLFRSAGRQIVPTQPDNVSRYNGSG